jgi:hypothetical protein
MFTIRNLGGVSLFLFGTTYLWLTPAFVTKGLDSTGGWWAVTRVLSLATILGFTLATWGLFQKASWWEGLATISAAAGIVTLLPYWVAAHASGETTPWFNVLIHAIGAFGVLVLLLVPTCERWVSGHVMAGS